jgi:hypothetical protein
VQGLPLEDVEDLSDQAATTQNRNGGGSGQIDDA